MKGVLLGTGVTAIIQSSSATSVMVVGFVNSGMMKVRQAIGIVLGAILGTSITGWIICLSDLQGGSGWVSFCPPPLTGVVAVVGILLRMFSPSQGKQARGDILLGFAVLMFGMQTMSASVSPPPGEPGLPGPADHLFQPLLGILVGMVFTCVLQSASAAVGILQALASTGGHHLCRGLSLTMGIAIGAALPVLLSSLGANIDGKRTAFVYLLIDVLGVVIWGTVFYAVNAAVHFSFLETVLSSMNIALLNTPLPAWPRWWCSPPSSACWRGWSAAFSPTGGRWGRRRRTSPGWSPGSSSTPALAIEQSRQAVENMAGEARANLEDAYYLIHDYQEKKFQFVLHREDIIDKYEDKLGSYLIQLTGKELTPQQNKTVTKYLHAIGDLERIGDHAMNIAECAKEIEEKGIVFSPRGRPGAEHPLSAVQEITHDAITAFTTGDLALAYRVEPLEEVIDALCDEMKLHHVDRPAKRASAPCTRGSCSTTCSPTSSGYPTTAPTWRWPPSSWSRTPLTPTSI